MTVIGYKNSEVERLADWRAMLDYKENYRRELNSSPNIALQDLTKYQQFLSDYVKDAA